MTSPGEGRLGLKKSHFAMTNKPFCHSVGREGVKKSICDDVIFEHFHSVNCYDNFISPPIGISTGHSSSIWCVFSDLLHSRVGTWLWNEGQVNSTTDARSNRDTGKFLTFEHNDESEHFTNLYWIFSLWHRLTPNRFNFDFIKYQASNSRWY